MPAGQHKYPQFGLRIPEETMDKLKYIAEYNGRSANREIEQLILRHIARFEKANGEIGLTDEDYAFIRKRTNSGHGGRGRNKENTGGEG